MPEAGHCSPKLPGYSLRSPLDGGTPVPTRVLRAADKRAQGLSAPKQESRPALADGGQSHRPDLETTEVCDRANKSPAGGPGVPLLLGALHLSGSSNIAAPHAVPTWGVPRLPLPLPFTLMARALPPREGSPPLTPSRLPQDPSLGGTPVLFPELSRRSHCTVAACIRAGAAPNCRLPTSTRCHP